MARLGSCSAEGCLIVEGGSCLEGFSDLGECPNFTVQDQQVAPEGGVDIAEPTETVEPQLEPSDDKARKAHVYLHTGNALTSSEARRLTAELSTTVVVLAGMVSSGKTTVLAELYEKYRRGKFAKHIFAGSQTILGFERICHYARAASGGDVEKTVRTVGDLENNLLHLDLVSTSTRDRKRLLVSDLSGEHFEGATESTDRLRKIPYLARANNLVLFVDCVKLASSEHRHVLVHQILVLLRGCREEKVLRPDCRITVVFSRHDLVNGIDDPSTFAGHQTELRKQIEARVAGFFDHSPDFLDLAARPEDINSKEYGLEKLLTAILRPPDRTLASLPSKHHLRRIPTRQIDSIAYRDLSDG